MKWQLMLSLAMVAGITACSKKEETKKIYSYRIITATCSVSKSFGSEAERCAGLANDSLNDNCAPESRASLFEQAGCDKAVAASSSIKDYFAGSTTRPTRFSGASRYTLPSRTREFELDDDGCWKGDSAWLNSRPECKAKYPTN